MDPNAPVVETAQVVVQAANTGERIYDVLAPYDELYIEQSWSWGEALCSCEVENLYKVYGGASAGGVLLVNVKEESGCWERCCCAPQNSLKLKFEFPGEEGNPSYVVERPGCCGAKPLLSCCSWSDACTDEMIMHKGNPAGEVGEMATDDVLFRTKQAPCCEAMFEPVIQVRVPGNDVPVLDLRGPMFFGGCSELCCSSKFATTNAEGKDIGFVKKKKPETCGQACAECHSDVDRYSIKFTENAGPGDKAAMVSAAFMADYMLFEQDNGMCTVRNGKVYITCFQCYCFGCLQSCNIVLQSNN